MHNCSVKNHDQTQQKGIIRKLFIVLMSVILVVGLMPTFSLAQGAYAQDASTALAVDSTTVTLDGNGGTFTVSSKPDYDVWDGITATAVSNLKVENGVYQLNSAADLAGFRDGINNYTIYDDNDENTTIPLSADAQLNVDCDMSCADWTPIALTVDVEYGMSADISYTGTFDGAGHTIKIVSNTEATNVKTSYMGLFAGVATPGVIENLALEGSISVTRSSVSTSVGIYVAAFVPMSYGATIQNCVNKIDITVESTQNATEVGGFTAYDRGSTIVNCGNVGNITVILDTSSYMPTVGGIAGDCYVTDAYAEYGGRSCIENCYNWGDILASGGGMNTTSMPRAGGIVGYAERASGNSGYLVNCYNSGEVTAVPYEGYSLSYAGALFGEVASGYLTNTTQLYVDNCYWAQSNLGITGNEVTSTYFHENDTGTYSDAASLMEWLQKVTESPDGASGLDYATWVASTDEGHEGYPCFASPSAGGAQEVDKITLAVDSDGYINPDDYDVPHREGCTFAGWNTESDGSGISYTKEQLLAQEFIASTTLYAQWTVTVTLDGNKGVFGEETQVSMWGGTISTTPTVDANGTYQITSADELAGFRDGINNGTISADANAKLNVDCDMSTESGVATWTPIGDFDGAHIRYSGTFDGGGHTVYIESEETSDDIIHWGFFTEVENGTVENLTIDGSFNITSTDDGTYGGVFTCYSYGGTFINCVNKATVTTGSTDNNNYSAGIVGWDNCSKIVNCGNEGNITGVSTLTDTARIGGIIGYSNTTATYGYRMCVENCYNWGDISATNNLSGSGSPEPAYAGGIISYADAPYANNYANYFYNCYSAGNVTAASSSAAYAHAGAIAGCVYCYDASTRPTYMERCYWPADSGLSLYGALYNTTEPITDGSGTYSDAESLLGILSGQSSPAGASGLAYATWVASTDADHVGLPCFGNVSNGTSDKLVLTMSEGSKIDPNDYDEPHREGYRFVEWNTEPDGSGISYTKEELLDLTFDADTTFYAIWAETTPIEVTLDGNDGTFTVETEIEPETDPWDGISYMKPDLEDDVYQIDSAANLAWFVAYVNGTGEADTTSTHYSANAVLNIDVVWNYLWMPIGYYRGSQSRTNSFTGTFDGNGHTVTINSDIIPTDVDSGIGAVTFNWGFISVLGQGGVVKDLTIDGKLTVTSANGDNSNTLYVGGIAGDVYYGSAVTGCVNRADITATTDSKGVYVGGITGEVHGDPTIVNCGNEGTISGETKGTYSGNSYALVGGIAGDVYPYVSSSFGSAGIVCLENCYNWGDVSATTAAAATTGAGGIAGRAFTTFNYSQDTTTTINNCYSTGTFEASNTDSSKLGAGAIIGYLYTSSTCTTTLSNCYWAPSLNVTLPYGLLSGNDNLTITNAAAYAGAEALLDTLNEQAGSTGASGIQYETWKADETNDDLPYFGSKLMGLAEVPSIKITVGANGMIAEGDYAEPHLEGYTFAGWNTEPDGSGISYTKEELLEVVFGEDTTIYAMWDEIKTTFDVTLDGNGGVFAETTDDTLVLTTDENGYLVGDIPEPTREGYAFTGWAFDREGTDPIDDIHAVQFTQDTMVYAQWDAIEYTIEVNTVGNGEVTVTVDENTTTEPIEATIGQTIEITVTPDDGYKIESITIKTNDNEIYSGTDSTCTFSMPPANVTIDVVFSAIPIPEYRIEVEAGDHGTVTIGYEEAPADELISFSVEADDDYEIADVVITDMDDNNISDQVSLDSDGEGNYMFVMPDFDVKVVVTFKVKESEPEPEPEPDPGPEPDPEPDPGPDPEPTATEITPNMFIVDTADEVYTGEPIEKTIASTLVEGVDYEVTYTDDVDAGTATIIITGIGDYEGTLIYEFTIERAFVRLAGDDRYGTMEEIDDTAFDTADTVVLAAGSNFPDALAAAGLAGTLDAPIVLTATEALSDEAAEEIARLGASSVVIVGGENSVSAAVVQALTAMGINVTRVAGADRYETAVEAYYAGLGSWGTSGNGTAKTAIIAAGASFPDTLSASSYAWWATAPIFLSSSDGLDEATQTAITSGGFERIVIVGGVNSVPASVELWAYEVASTQRLSGDNRYDTSVEFATWAHTEGMSFNNAGIATGKNFPDALAGGALCGQRGSVVLLADYDGGTQAVDLLSAHKDEVSRIYFLGGVNSVTSELATLIESSLK